MFGFVLASLVHGVAFGTGSNAMELMMVIDRVVIPSIGLARDWHSRAGNMGMMKTGNRKGPVLPLAGAKASRYCSRAGGKQQLPQKRLQPLARKGSQPLARKLSQLRPRPKVLQVAQEGIGMLTSRQ